MELNFRRINLKDASNKIQWYNDPEVNEFFHYENNLTVEGTLEWLKRIESDNTRFENIIEVKLNNKMISIGIIGLFEIDLVNKKAGFYITIGDKNYQGKGVGKKISYDFLNFCFDNFDLHKIYLYTDEGNIRAQNLYENLGFKKEGLLRDELLYKNNYISRYYYGILRNELKKL